MSERQSQPTEAALGRRQDQPGNQLRAGAGEQPEAVAAALQRQQHLLQSQQAGGEHGIQSEDLCNQLGGSGSLLHRLHFQDKFRPPAPPQDGGPGERSD